ncbi:MAG TPA: NifU family protein [Caulobacteraceae bacterium]|jgi:Fe-S cluster biogenesis protein NfuA|nr:NifU family protein [Caulobacteraceae bacterium]
MFIQTEQTPNPLTLKFLPGKPVTGEGTNEFRDAEAAEASPLARALFEIDGVARVFFGPDFVTVTRAEDGLEWRQLKAPILAAIMEHYTSGATLYAEGARANASGEHDSQVYEGDTAQVVSEIKELLDTRIRPAVAQDGGDILFDRFDAESGVVWLQMRGSCSGCPSSVATLKSGVENLLKHYVPEVTRVEQVAL